VLLLAIKDAPHSSSKNTETTSHCCCCVLLHFLRESLRAQNLESRHLKPRTTATPARVGRRSSFWGAQLCVTARLYERLLPGGAIFRSTTFWWCALLYHYFQKGVRGAALLPFFLNQIRSTTSNCSTCQILGTAPPGPASGYNIELSFTGRVLSVFIQIKREHQQSL
jgi:hypothetical protein